MDTQELRKQVLADLSGLKTIADCGAFHQKYLAKSGSITSALSGLGKVAPEKRKEVGQELNLLKRDIESKLFAIQEQIKDKEMLQRLNNDPLVDITIPKLNARKGVLHPITVVTREIEQIFSSMGFIVEDGAEIVTEFENFDSLNIPSTHPARDMQDTFWLSNGGVLKTHTSASQNRMLKKYGPEFAAIFPGRCFRNENMDASHETTFFQVEGMMVGKDVSIANLIYFMKTMLSAVFKKDIAVRLRPGYFPFVEPGFELDASCMFCDAKGCSVCKQGGWVELCPCGMVHPKVLELGGVDPDKYTGFAFGLGLTRLAMMKFGINDIRTLNSGNLDFLGGNS